MDGILQGGILSLVVYGNYLLFAGNFKAVFWALSYSVLSREIKNTHLRIFHPFISILSFFPVFFFGLLPPLLLLLAGRETLNYSYFVITQLNNYSESIIRNTLLKLSKYAFDYLEMKKDTFSDSYLYYKIYLKWEDIKNEMIIGGRVTITFISSFLFFLGLSFYFCSLPKSPLLYIFKPISRAGDISRAFDRIVYNLAVVGLFGIIWGFSAGLYFNSELVVVNSLLSGFLSVFPVLPLFIYSIFSSIELFLQGRILSSVLFLLQAVVQQIVTGRIKRKGNNYLSSISTVLGLTAFGLPGVILGPFLVHSLMIIWPREETERERQTEKTLQARIQQKRQPAQKEQPAQERQPKKLTKTMEILRKNK